MVSTAWWLVYCLTHPQPQAILVAMSTMTLSHTYGVPANAFHFGDYCTRTTENKLV
ncbi:hypothetical protein M405DRAFT_133056 [Rhizopogon salebrosus TDB-379]|nr:hypothetical protein M405DRAFT_133056 [Rhizopogon salebrosus TDB-379]